jgi:CHAT domain-containing protein
MEAKNLRGEKLRSALTEEFIDNTPSLNTSLSNNLDEELRSLILPDSILSVLPIELESKILVVADGKLSNLSFSSLKDSQGSYLVDKYIIIQSPSISTLAVAAKLRNKIELVARVETLAFGLSPNNTLNNSTLQTIADAKDELKTATNFKAKSLIGVNSVKSSLCEEAKGKHILHIIAYSYLSDKQPLKSFILVTPQTNEQGTNIHNGVVTLVELENCITNNDLIVLTANQSGFSGGNGTGLSFLANTLALNNNSATLLSLWQTDGKITSTFMEAFYEQLKKTSDITMSYHKALLKLREKHKSPSQWGAFVLMGEPVN